MRTREEVDEQIKWLEKRQKLIIDTVGCDAYTDMEYVANVHYIYALMWVKGFVSGYRF